MAYDLLLKGARVMDPAQGVDGIRDVGITSGRRSPKWPRK